MHFGYGQFALSLFLSNTLRFLVVTNRSLMFDRDVFRYVYAAVCQYVRPNVQMSVGLLALEKKNAITTLGSWYQLISVIFFFLLIA